MQPVRQAIEEIENSKLPKDAILFFLNNAKTVPSHDFDHAYKVSLISLESAAKSGFRGTKLQDLFISSMFHDIIRTSRAVTDTESEVASAKLATVFCRQHAIDKHRTNFIQQMIVNPSGTKIGMHLDFADAAHFLLESRIQAFARESTQLREMESKKVAELYVQKFGGMVKNLPPDMRKRLDLIARKVLGKTGTALLLGKLSFNLENPTAKIKEVPSFSSKERMNATFDSLSSLALQHAKSDQNFSKRILVRLNDKRFWSQYDVRDVSFMDAKLKSLNKILGRMRQTPKILSAKLATRLAHEHNEQKMKFRRRMTPQAK